MLDFTASGIISIRRYPLSERWWGQPGLLTISYSDEKSGMSASCFQNHYPATITRYSFSDRYWLHLPRP